MYAHLHVTVTGIYLALPGSQATHPFRSQLAPFLAVAPATRADFVRMQRQLSVGQAWRPSLSASRSHTRLESAPRPCARPVPACAGARARSRRSPAQQSLGLGSVRARLRETGLRKNDKAQGYYCLFSIIFIFFNLESLTNLTEWKKRS
jgi:hypothetical protein